jgi:hypothetical protein
MKAFPNAAVITVDDDMFYHRCIVQRLVESYEQNKTVIHCHHARVIPIDLDGRFIPIGVLGWALFSAGKCMPKASPLLFAEGIGAVLYPPGVLNHRMFYGKVFQALCPFHDDL